MGTRIQVLELRQVGGLIVTWDSCTICASDIGVSDVVAEALFIVWIVPSRSS